jgi:spore maturation protein CgeB
MRVFYAAPSSPISHVQSNLWRENLRGSLVNLGHEIIDFRYDLDTMFENLDPADARQEEFIAKNRPLLGDALLTQIREEHSHRPLDVLFTYFYNACVQPEVIREIRSLGIIAINWFCNASYQFHLVSEIAPAYDYCLVPEKFRLEDYRQIGATPIYCQEAANPNVYRPYAGPQVHDVGFIGQAYGERPRLIEWLAAHGVAVTVWGAGWEHFRKRRPSFNPMHWGKVDTSPKIPERLIGGILSDDDMVRTFSQTKINLGFAGCWTNENAGERITQIRLRDFEVPMSGGFYLTEYQAELEEFFEIDSEIACYRDKEELLEKIRFYLNRRDLRERIRFAGRKRCLNEHTWEKRFETVFARMGLQR